ncbi:MAG: hypothetical protein A3F35_01700 [Candidatus Woykebacteria bacterium RIFCSPHIGHO2_12_FULL_45_10]|uniref:SHS2 domain-containing protein n=1 Tax=Candidatus Woykebacteria bacterium RIFCSPHIGHO2_12_FULL_45_10 TaxID=1802603 RepID=A0A1G1WSV5_9BACT|nr:MAG: hypothetical protein A3F35_01700 [Candidatus Woykebacteria bacterium RIFCSPHIGHO2_12_FULL_45_10]
MSLFGKLIPNRRKKGKEFLVIEIGLGRVSAAIYRGGETHPHLVSVGRKEFSSYENIFNATLEAVDALAAISKKIPKKAILGVTDGVLRTTTTVARYDRPKPKEPVDAGEVGKVLEQISSAVKAEDLKTFFSVVASAKLDEASITNPIGLKGEKAALACFIALKSPSELAMFDKIIDELELRAERAMPSSFAVSRALLKQNLNDALVLRVGKEKSEGALLSEGHIFEILPFDIGEAGVDYISIGIEAIVSLLEKEKRPQTIWLYSDEDGVNLEGTVEKLNNFAWEERLGYEKAPEITTKEIIEGVASSDTGLTALAYEYLEDAR